MDASNRQSRKNLLVLRAQGGDREALDELLQGLQKPLYRHIRGLIADSGLVDDVLQDVFLVICRKLRHLREPRFFRAWAYRIATRRALRVAIRERGRAGVPLDEAWDEAPAVKEPAYDPALTAKLPSLLAVASPASRAVLSLHYLQDMSLDETADVLDLPVGTVKSRLAYGLAAIRRYLTAKEASTQQGGIR